MKNNLFYEFTVNKETNTITVKREFLAPISLVWDAWTSAEILDQWWAAKGWTSHTKWMEFKIDGHRHYQMKGPEGEVFWGLTSYLTIDVHLGFAGEENFVDEEAVVNPEYPQSKYSIAFTEKEGKTSILHQTTYASLEELEASLQHGFERGTIDAYARLDGVLAR